MNSSRPLCVKVRSKGAISARERKRRERKSLGTKLGFYLEKRVRELEISFALSIEPTSAAIAFVALRTATDLSRVSIATKFR